MHVSLVNRVILNNIEGISVTFVVIIREARAV